MRQVLNVNNTILNLVFNYISGRMPEIDKSQLISHNQGCILCVSRFILRRPNTHAYMVLFKNYFKSYFLNLKEFIDRCR